MYFICFSSKNLSNFYGKFYKRIPNFRLSIAAAKSLKYEIFL